MYNDKVDYEDQSYNNKVYYEDQMYSYKVDYEDQCTIIKWTMKTNVQL